MSGHAKLSPSSAHRWMKCPGSIREAARYPDDTSGPAAIDGTHTHTLLEKCLVENEHAETYMGQTLTDHEGEFVVEQDRCDRVQVALAYIRAREAELFGPVAVRAESKVNPGSVIGREDCSGTADCILVSDHTLEVIDYKDGMSPVSAKDNWQMILYLIGVVAEYDTQFTTLRMTIIQPKLALRGMDTISSVDLTTSELHEYIKQFESGAAATDNPDAPLVAGEPQCQWCPHKGNCTALASQAMEKAQVMFSGVGVAQQAAEKNPHELSDDTIREIIEAKSLIQGWLSGVEEEAMKRLKAGRNITGLKLVKGNGRRKWSMTDDEIAEKLKKMSVPKDVIFPKNVISIAQLEKARWTKVSKGEDKEVSLTERQLKNIHENYVTKSEGSLQVALDTDHRKAVNTNAADIFKDVAPAAPVEPTTPALPDWMQGN